MLNTNAARKLENKESVVYQFPKLKKDGTVKKICQNKKKGQKSEVYPFEVQDMPKMIRYYEDHEMWVHYLAFILSLNLARRVGDMLSLKWIHFFDPKTGKFRSDILEINEEKTDKLANPHINQTVRETINKYIEKTGCEPEKNGYQEFVFTQLSGNFKGSVLSDSGYLKAMKKAAAEVGIEYNVGTHSPRKTFGMISRMIHPGDYDSMELLQSIYNHSDTKTTKHYIGLTRQKINAYYDDFGTFFDEYVTGEKEYHQEAEKPIVSLYTNDLRNVLREALKAGRDGENEADAMCRLLEMIENVAK